MPKILAEGDILKTTVYCQIGNQVSQNVFYHRVGPTLAAQYTDLQFATVFNALVKDDYLAMFTANATYRGVTTQVIKPVLYDAVGVTSAAAGVVAGDNMPPGTAISVERKTGVGGRKNRGRFYIPFPAESHNDASGHPTTAFLTLAGNLAAKTIQTIALTGGANEIGVVPIQYPSDAPLAGRALTGYKVATEWTMNNSRSYKSAANTPPV